MVLVALESTAKCCGKCQITAWSSCRAGLFSWLHITDDVLTGPLPNTDNFFIVADKQLKNIYQVDATSGATAQLLPFGTASNPLGVAYDSTRKLVYWTDYNAASSTINRYSLLTSISSVIYSDPYNAGKHIGLTSSLHKTTHSSLYTLSQSECFFTTVCQMSYKGKVFLRYSPSKSIVTFKPGLWIT